MATTDKKITITIVDDHQMVLDGLRYMVSLNNNIEVIDVFNSGAELLKGLRQKMPDVLLLDIQLTDYVGEELIPILTKEYPGIKILAITSIDTPIRVRELIRKGCLGYLLKNTKAKRLIEAIETVALGIPYVEDSLKEQILYDVLNFKEKPHNQQVILTRREKEILQMIVNEDSSKEIAKKLFISIDTVNNHRSHIMEKMDVKNVAGLVKKALMLGLVAGD